MLVRQKALSVSQAAVLCSVGRTTVGYWIRSKKLRANRVGRNYSIPVQDLLVFLKSTGQQIPPALQDENLKGPIFKSVVLWHMACSREYGKYIVSEICACYSIKEVE